MSVDKFGRISTGSRGVVRNVRGERGIGFNLTKEGDYDMQMKNLKNLNLPMGIHDAATKKYVDDSVEEIRKELILIREDEKSRFFNRKVYVDAKIDEMGKELVSQKRYIDSADIQRKKYVDDLIEEMKLECSSLKEYVESFDAAGKQYIDENLKKLYKQLSDIHVGYTKLESQR